MSSIFYFKVNERQEEQNPADSVIKIASVLTVGIAIYFWSEAIKYQRLANANNIGDDDDFQAVDDPEQ